MSALLPLIAQAGFDNDHMGGGWGWLMIVVLIGVMGWLVWSIGRGAASNGRGSTEDPIEVLKTRYAGGELTTEEFQERLRTIDDARR